VHTGTSCPPTFTVATDSPDRTNSPSSARVACGGRVTRPVNGAITTRSGTSSTSAVGSTGPPSVHQHQPVRQLPRLGVLADVRGFGVRRDAPYQPGQHLARPGLHEQLCAGPAH